MKKNVKSIIFIILISFFIVSSAAGIEVKTKKQTSYLSDLDPLVDVEVTVEIQKIRAFDKYDQQVRSREYIDLNGDPDLYIEIIINDQEFRSDIWHDTKYIYDTQFSATLDVPDDEEFVTVEIQLWDWNSDGDVLCDIGDENDDVKLTYSIKTGHWTGDDHLEDPSGYGRLNGCDDGSIYKQERDCELWFDIYQNDFDDDGIPYWTEVNTYGTDPEVENSGDPDEDGIPVAWEWKWNYDPFAWEDHENIDPEKDSINNFEEYLTSEQFSDPFRKDLFVELDQMEESPEGEKSLLPEGAKELLYTAYNRQNIVYHLDDGSWDESGSDMIPFSDQINHNGLDDIYQNYFLHGNEENWRKGVFHYGVVVYSTTSAAGYVFRANAFQISSAGHEKKASEPLLDRDTVYASAYMHETGHTLGFWPVPGHTRNSMYPWQLGWWLNRPYKSCMNYGYMYYTVDYSDGSRLIKDYDDWSRMRLDSFEQGW
jgi:hypothetical protein